MKQIRIFDSGNSNWIATQVNNFIKNNNVQIVDIQYSGGFWLSGPSVMVVFEGEIEDD